MTECAHCYSKSSRVKSAFLKKVHVRGFDIKPTNSAELELLQNEKCDGKSVTYGHTDGRPDGQTDGRTDERTDGRTDRQTDRQTDDGDVIPKCHICLQQVTQKL